MSIEPDNNLSTRAKRALLWSLMGLAGVIAASFLFMVVSSGH